MKKKFDAQQWLPVAILAIAGALLYIGLTDNGPTREAAPSARSAHAQQVVNKYLSSTAEKLAMQRKLAEVQAQKINMDYPSTAPGTAYVAPREGGELKEDQRADAVAEDLGVGPKVAMPTDPMSLIHHQIFEEQRAREMNDAFKKEYARKFLENARRGGYDVVLSEDFRVISVKPLRRPTRAFDE